MLFPSTASIGSERFVIVGVYIKIGFLQGFTGGKRRQGVCATRILRHRLVLIKSLDFSKALPGGETEEGVCFQWVLKVVGATIDGFLR